MAEEPNKIGEETGRDPISGKFIEGNPGGPGAPKGARHMSTLLEEAIKKVAEGEGEAADIQIVKKVIEKAKAGEFKHTELIWDRLEGKAPQKIDITSNEETIGRSAEIVALTKKLNELYGSTSKSGDGREPGSMGDKAQD